MPPRLWGPWVPVTLAGGGCIVSLASGDNTKPTLYVFGDPLPGQPALAAANRQRMCRALADYLTGGDRPPWLDDFYARGPYAAECLTGAFLLATGPWLRSTGQPLVLTQDQTLAARRARRRLIRTLLEAPASE